MSVKHDKILDVSITYKNKNIGKCSYVSINRFAPDSARDLTLKKCNFFTEFEFDYLEELFVRINYFNKFDSELWLYDFKFIIIDYDTSDYENIKLYGNLNVENNDIYSQDIIDVFNLWQNKKDINWGDLHINNSISKLNYLKACGMWSGLSKKPPQSSNYLIDCSKLDDKYDFYHILAESFFGVRSYMGVSLHTLEDCFIEFHKRLNGVITIKFKNLDRLKIVFKDEYNELIALMNRYNLKVITG